MLLQIITLFLGFVAAVTREVAAETYYTGSQIFEITDYAIVKEGIKSGSCIQSSPFTVGGYQWVTEVYPQSSRQENADSIGIFVRLVNTTDKVKAIFTNHLLDWTTSTWSSNTPQSPSVMDFTGGNAAESIWGKKTFMKRSELEGSNYLKDNYKLQVKTTLWVQKSSTSVTVPLPSTVVPEVSTA